MSETSETSRDDACIFAQLIHSKSSQGIKSSIKLRHYLHKSKKTKYRCQSCSRSERIVRAAAQENRDFRKKNKINQTYQTASSTRHVSLYLLPIPSGARCSSSSRNLQVSKAVPGVRPIRHRSMIFLLRQGLLENMASTSWNP